MARVEGGAVIIDTDWPGLKNQIDSRNVNFKYEEDSTAYSIFAIDGQYFYQTVIYKSGQAPQNQSTYDTWRAEFESDYKNRTTDFNSTQPVFITTVDGYSVVLKDGASPTVNDGYGIAVIGIDGSNYRMLKTDTSGRPVMVGAGTAGSPAGGIITIQGAVGGTAIPISGSITADNASVGSNDAAIPTSSTLIGGSDGTNLRSLRVFDVDTGAGQQWVLGVGLRKAAGGGSVEFGTSSDPIRIDPTGTTTQPISGTVTANQGGSWTVTANAGTGNFTVIQPTASNLRAQLASESTISNPITSTALLIGGSDGTNLRPIFLDSSGRQIVIGGAANGAAVAGNPVLVAGSDGTNARSIRTATDGTVRVDPTGTTTQPVSINAGNNNIGDVDVATIVGATDSGNSTTSTLGSGATFTGTAFDTLNYPTAVVIVKSDVASATNGLKFQWSGDGINWDVESGSEVLANGGRGFHVSHRGRYFRIQYVNGGSAQTFFRLNVIHRPSTVGIITRPLDDNIDDKNFAQITRSVLTAKTPGGSYVNINANNGGNLKTTNDSAYNEDTVHNTGDMGTFVLGVRNDSASSLTNANGDYSPFATDSAGRLGVSDLGGSITVDGTVITVGAAADGAPPSGNPVLIAGQDGTNVQSIATDGYGRIQVTITGSSSNTQVEGRAADGVTPVGNPVYIGGTDGSNIQAILTDTQGRIVIAPSGASTTSGFSFGEIVLATTTISAIRSTTYTEPSVGAQRSISSANANDTSAGTGARSVKITYYTLSAGTVAGPFTETVTLNGTTPVNTVATNICYIEEMEVVTVGSGGVNAGIITLFGSTGGGGGTVWTIAAGANRTYGAHHYVPSNKTCNVTTFNGGIKGADTSGFILRAKDPTNANSANIQISDLLRAPSSGNTPIRTYGTPIKISGPSVITAFAVPDSTSSRTYYASFDFYEE